MKDYKGEKADLTLSLDVVFHLVEDDVFESCMRRLFSSSDRYVIIYSSNTDAHPLDSAPHVKHRRFTLWIEKNAPDWRLVEHIPNKYPLVGDPNRESFADFYIYERLRSTP